MEAYQYRNYQTGISFKINGTKIQLKFLVSFQITQKKRL